MSDKLATALVGDIVATDFRAAAVFEQFGIDFCCGGRRPLDEACRTASADPADVIRTLEALSPVTEQGSDVSAWTLDRLIDHIVSTHHAYVRSAIPTVTRYLAKLVTVHGERHPELADVSAQFMQLSADLEQHMFKEEQILFPYVAELAMSAVGGRHVPSPFGTVENPIRMMEREHEEAAAGLRVIRKLTHGYAVPTDGCTTYAVTMQELDRFERDLHQHVHLENNILFPKAIQLENGGY